VLANTEVLHEKINQLSSRVRHLEDALAESYGTHSTHNHPLLTEELLKIKRPLERESNDSHQVKEDKPDSGDTIKSMGSLSVFLSGFSFFPPSLTVLGTVDLYHKEAGQPFSVQQPAPGCVSFTDSSTLQLTKSSPSVSPPSTYVFSNSTR